MECLNTNCKWFDRLMTDNCSKGEPPDVENCAMRCSIKAEQLDKFHFHEFIDRCHLACSFIDDNLRNHPIATAKYKTYLDEAQNCLSAASNMASNESDITFFCYYCGKKMWGKHHKILRSSEDGHCRVFHKQCAKLAKKEEPGFWEDRQRKNLPAR